MKSDFDAEMREASRSETQRKEAEGRAWCWFSESKPQTAGAASSSRGPRQQGLDLGPQGAAQGLGLTLGRAAASPAGQA